MKELRQLLNRGAGCRGRGGEGTVRVEVKKSESLPTKSEGTWRTTGPLPKGLCRM